MWPGASSPPSQRATVSGSGTGAAIDRTWSKSTSMAGAAAADRCEVDTVQARPHRISRARLLERVFDIDMHTCPNCGGGELKIIAAMLERPVIAKILTHFGLDPQPPPRGRAREVVQDWSRLNTV